MIVYLHCCGTYCFSLSGLLRFRRSVRWMKKVLQLANVSPYQIHCTSETIQSLVTLCQLHLGPDKV